jgi:hypothetical protein
MAKLMILDLRHTCMAVIQCNDMSPDQTVVGLILCVCTHIHMHGDYSTPEYFFSTSET